MDDTFIICVESGGKMTESLMKKLISGNKLFQNEGSIEYAAAHLGCKLIIMLGHTGCGAVSAALSNHADGFIAYITEGILEAVEDERDPDKACRLNVIDGVDRIKREFALHPEISDAEVRGAIYNIEDGQVERL